MEKIETCTYNNLLFKRCKDYSEELDKEFHCVKDSNIGICLNEQQRCKIIE